MGSRLDIYNDMTKEKVQIIMSGHMIGIMRGTGTSIQIKAFETKSFSFRRDVMNYLYDNNLNITKQSATNFPWLSDFS